MGKKRKNKAAQGAYMQGMGGMGYGAQGMGMHPGMMGQAMAYGGQGTGAWNQPNAADFQAGMATGLGTQAPTAAASPLGMDSSLLQQVPAFLRSRNTEQFLIGAVIGAAAAWVLSDEELRGKIVKSAMKLYAGVAGGFEEMKEQMADLKAEVQAERDGQS